MIELKVEEYCHNCPDFEADVTKHGGMRLYDYPWVPGESEVEVVGVHTTVRCAHAARCRAVKRYLEKQQKGE